MNQNFSQYWFLVFSLPVLILGFRLKFLYVVNLYLIIYLLLQTWSTITDKYCFLFTWRVTEYSFWQVDSESTEKGTDILRNSDWVLVIILLREQASKSIIFKDK